MLFGGTVDLSFGYGTDRRQRPDNQDCHGVFRFPRFILAVVCDGMGGHVGGAQAAALAVRTVHDEMAEAGTTPIPAAIERALQRTNHAIHEASRKNHRLSGMGTTAVVAVITETEAHIAHVGDSRAYLVRKGECKAITRDHTMVNLFVDAELLTPEDAATHPEAHVLSRSLGSDRQVDVEISAPVPLRKGDTIFLCTDGVHATLTDFELSNIDWSKPQEGVQQVLRIVEARGGDDNATAVAVVNALSSERIEPTPPPEVRRLDDLAGRPTPVPMPDAVRQPIGPAVADGKEPETEKQARRPDTGPMPLENEGPVRPPRLTPTGTPHQRGKVPTIKRVTGPSSRVLVIGAGVFAVSIALCVGIVGTAIRAPGTPAVVNVEDPAARAKIAVTGPDGQIVNGNSTPSNDDAASAASPGSRLFSPSIPAPPRRLPHRAVEYTQPPPGGAIQWNAVQAARNRNCARSLDMVRQGMAMSVDHATLYAQAWNCFNDTHSLPLSAAQVLTWEDFAFIDHHFQGTPEAREQARTPESDRLPVWARPAIGGVEFRLEAWSQSGDKELIVEACSDLLGDPRVADDLARDLLLEAYAAAGLSQVEEPNSRVIDWWARRVFVVARALHGPAGRLLETQRPDVLPVLRTLLTQATTPRNQDGASLELEADPGSVGEGAFEGGLPRSVALALAVALGADVPTGGPDQDVATKATTPGTRPTQRREPDVPAVPMPVKVYRYKEPVIESEP